MKQSITKKQFNELSSEEKHKFYDPWWNYNKQEWRDVADLDCRFVMDECPPNIGQMIKFLGDDWFMYLSTLGISENQHKNLGVEGLCNNLWEAVKYKLNEL